MMNLSLNQISQQLFSLKISSIEITKLCIQRIKKFDKVFGSFLLLDEKGALVQAEESDKRRAGGKALGVLDGVPIGLKDMILTKGLASTAASKILENYIPPYDATVTAKLKAAGCVILGKLNLDEFAMGSSTESSAYKLTRNPWNKDYTPGGSSGGSAAAIAAQFCLGTLGTDTGGSIRQPASYCGIVGLKPTYGRVSRYGVVAFASSLDQVGPMASDVKSVAMLLEAIAGHDDRDATSVDLAVPNYSQELTGDIKGLRVGVPKEFFADGINVEVRASVMNSIAAMKNRGAQIIELSLPATPHAVATYYVIATAEASSNLSRYDGVCYGPRLGEKDGLQPMYEQTRGRLFGAEVKRRIMLGTYVLSAGYYDAYYLQAQKVRRLFANDFAEAFKSVDVIIGPTTPTAAFRIGEKVTDPLQMYLNDIFTISANLAGLPGISLNAGFTSDGMPIGVQLMGPAFCESTLLRAAHALEADLGVSKFPVLAD